MLDFQAVGDKIHNLRTAAGLSQDNLAETLYVTRQAVSRWELGQTLPSVDNLAELCRLFNVTFEELLCLDEPARFDKDDIFKGHSREFVVNSLANGKLETDIADKLYLFSPSERMVILKAVKDGKVKADGARLAVKLTDEEKSYLFGGILKNERF